MTTPQVTSWGEDVVQRLLERSICPVCEQDRLTGGCCPRCGADLRGSIGKDLWDASTAAASAVRARDALLRSVPRSWRTDGAVAPAQGAPPPRTPVPPPSASPVDPAPAGAGATLQSVLAVAGAGLFAVAAIVFTFFNPDLADRAQRSAIVGLVTLLFLGGSWLFARRGLQFSAEAVGALGLVFVGLDVHALAQLGDSVALTWTIGAIATAAAGVVMFAAAVLVRLRVWLWGALLAVAAVPAMLGYAAGSGSAAVSGSGFAAACGHVASAFVAAALIEQLPRLTVRLEAPSRPGTTIEPARVSLVALQIVAVLSAPPIALSGGFEADLAARLLSVGAVLALVALHALFATRHALQQWWSYVFGAAVVATLAFAVSGVLARDAATVWWPAAVPTVAAFGFAALAVLPLPKSAVHTTAAGGAVTVLGLVAVIPLAFAALAGVSAVFDFLQGVGVTETFADPVTWAHVIGLVGISAGLTLFGRLASLHGRREGRVPLSAIMTVTDVAALLVAAVAVLALTCVDLLPLVARLGIALTLSGAASLALLLLPRVREARVGIRASLQLSIHVAIVTAAMVSWRDPASAPAAGIAVVTVLGLTAATVSRSTRFLHVGAGFAYALVCLGIALDRTGLGDVVVLCLVASSALVGAIVTTFLRRVGARAWYAVLAVTAVPFAAGIVQVVFERSGWTALSTSLMFALALSLLLTRRPGLNILLRTLSAGMLVPAVAVVVVCLGAQVLAISASPVTLPIIAAIVALVLPSTTLIRDALRRNRLDADAATAARLAIEASALLTGLIATGLALGREAAGLGTTFLVLIILGVGAAAAAAFNRRRYGWWVAGAAFTGALWCVWAMTGVDLLEAYVLPPALGAPLVAVLLAARGAQARALYAAGLGVALLPSLALLVLVEPDARTAVEVPWRALALLAAGWMLWALGVMLGRVARLRPLVPPTLLAAGLAAVAGPLLGLRMGFGADLTYLRGASLFLACFAASAAAAAVMALAARGIRTAAPSDSRVRASRWLLAPAVLALAVGTWSGIERDWFSIWAMWTLMLALLTLMLVTAARGPRTTLPPVWFLFAVSFVTAVVAWSPRDLRVEWFSLPLGAFLIMAGVCAMRGRPADAAARRTLGSWPSGWEGSWALLGPGIVTMMSASIVATFTDPLTWRAILVMVLALAAILVGAARRLAAPFLIGLVVLPIENVFVFTVQIGRGIESMPWWITLAVIGAVLLIIAVTYERRSGDALTMTARVRDLR